MDNEDVILDQMEATRTSLTEKLETLESKVASTVETASTNVAETVEAVKESVEDTVATVKDSVQETITAVKDTVHDSVDAIKDFLDIPGQVERRPWVMLGGAVAVGFIAGKLLGSKPAAVRLETASAPSLRAYENGRSGTRETPAPTSGLLDRLAPEIDKLKGLAIGALMGMVREMVVQAVPVNLGDSLSEIINNATEKLGGTPVNEEESSATPGQKRSTEKWDQWAKAN